MKEQERMEIFPVL